MVHAESHFIVFEWDAPSDNNSPLLRYNIYLSSKRIKLHETSLEKQSEASGSNHEHDKSELRKVGVVDVKEERFYELKNLDKNTAYYVVVTTENMYGEGYKAYPSLIRTLAEDLDSEAYTPYVWGNNANSEIGLSDEQVRCNIAFYVKSSIRKVLRNDLYQTNSVVQVAAGNSSSVFLIIDKDSHAQSIIFQGQTPIVKDQSNTKTVFGQTEVDSKIETIASVPFAIEF